MKMKGKEKVVKAQKATKTEKAKLTKSKAVPKASKPKSKTSQITPTKASNSRKSTKQTHPDTKDKEMPRVTATSADSKGKSKAVQNKPSESKAVTSQKRQRNAKSSQNERKKNTKSTNSVEESEEIKEKGKGKRKPTKKVEDEGKDNNSKDQPAPKKRSKKDANGTSEPASEKTISKNQKKEGKEEVESKSGKSKKKNASTKTDEIVDSKPEEATTATKKVSRRKRDGLSDEKTENAKKRVRKGKKTEIDENDLYFKEYKHAYEDPDWDGNEDDAGSVQSGVMEEDFCFECGLSTLDADCWQGVIMCDCCDGEYHLKCLGLQVAPENEFICNRCIKEQANMKGLDFSVGDRFNIPAKQEEERKVVYSPSRPLEAAWEECVKKGLMVVSEVFPYELMRKLTHGVIENRTKSGRIVDVWRGAVEEVPRRLRSSAFHNVVDREGRYDLKLPEFVVEELKLNEILEPILSKLRGIMGTPTPQIRTHNVVFVPVGSHSQQWHTDDSMKKHKVHRYFTVLIHLNSLDNQCGGTEVWSDERQLSDLIRGRPGDALVFNGSLLHRGQANLGYAHRFFYYASFACGGDMNVGVM